MEKIIAIREYKDKINAGFEVETDKQCIKLLIDDDLMCSESYGYFWCNDDVNDFIGANVLDVTVTDKALSTKKIEHNLLKIHECLFVNVETDKGTLQFVAYNQHNGYYGHDVTVECAQITHTETL